MTTPKTHAGQAVRSTPLLGGTSLSERDCHVIGIFCDEVERMAERNMLKTGKLEGAHYAAMRQLRATLHTPNTLISDLAHKQNGVNPISDNQL